MYCLNMARLRMQLMKTIRILLIIILSLILLLGQLSCGRAAIKNIPPYVKVLKSNIEQTFHTKVLISRTKATDYIERQKYAVIRLQGQGRLKLIAFPFELMHDLFITNHWQEDWKYAADGHGSTSTAYRQGTHFCIVSVQIDSSDEDAAPGHTPSKFWFTIDCRESNGQ